jgi:hypothetical protein
MRIVNAEEVPHAIGHMHAIVITGHTHSVLSTSCRMSAHRPAVFSFPYQALMV